MSLVARLAATTHLHDLPALLAAVGYEPLWQELPEGALVARAGDFYWVAHSATGPGAARRAATLSRGGRLAAVVVHDPAARTLELAVGFHGAPARRVALDQPGGADLACLERLRPEPGALPLATAARVAEALATEDVGAAFFRAFRGALAAIRDDLPAAIPPADRHALALLQLTRVLVLYFVQAKGWLDGDARFLRRAIDRCLAAGGSIHRHVLRPLFFGALNRPVASRSRALRAFGTVPFLNGGLFEPHPLERRWTPDIGSGAWVRAFDDLFERYHFVVARHDGPGIAPDMLGHVFEGVMDPDLRAASGSFYTPAPLVHAVLRSGLAALLAGRLRIGDDQAERLLDDPSPAARAILEHATVLDPAAGSGAFLLGALEQLTRPWAGTPAARAARVRQVVARNLFGVDINANAVRLAELRLWLAVIAADPTERPDQVAPLPNLDALLRQGDSLADPGMGELRLAAGHGLVLRRLRLELATVTGAAKHAAARALRRAEREAFRASLSAALERVEHRLAEALAAGKAPGIFGARAGLGARARRELEALRAERTRLRRQLRESWREERLPWFHFESHFADVFAASGGFDLVVGNPPWVRAERLAPAQRAALAARYRWWRAGPRSSGYAHAPDLAVAFLERAHELVAPGGAVAMLVPAKLLTAAYGRTARDALSRQATLHLVAETASAGAGGFDATVYPLAVTWTRTPAPAGHRLRGALGGGQRIRQSTLGAGPWILAPDGQRQALNQVRGDHPRLDEQFPCHLGVKTGLDRAFLDPDDTVEAELLRWALRGRDLAAFLARPRRRLLWTHAPHGAPLSALPEGAARFLAPHRRALVARRDYAGGPWWTLFRTNAATALHRVAWPDLSRQLAATPLPALEQDGMIPLNSCYVLTAPSRVAALRVAAWLNSTWIRAAARQQADRAAGGYARFNARVVGSLPLPASVLGDAALDRLAKAALRDPDPASPWQEPLDEITAGHLGLATSHRRALAEILGTRTGAGC